ncbi:hypothetical protein ACEU2D_15115 [Brevibacillus laterosporus]|uniref:hypothetical protein n=1 Tax=Brevibacillus laterosporus TaxID=1465 RepID=UPI0035A60993
MYRFASNPKQLNINGIYKTEEGDKTLKFKAYLDTRISPPQYRVDGLVWFNPQAEGEPTIYITGQWLQAGPLLAYLWKGTWNHSHSNVYASGVAGFYFDENDKKVKVNVRLYPHPQGVTQYKWRATKIR